MVRVSESAAASTCVVPNTPRWCQCGGWPIIVTLLSLAAGSEIGESLTSC
jgi:hypothetical protein